MKKTCEFQEFDYSEWNDCGFVNVLCKLDEGPEQCDGCETVPWTDPVEAAKVLVKCAAEHDAWVNQLVPDDDIPF